MNKYIKLFLNYTFIIKLQFNGEKCISHPECISALYRSVLLFWPSIQLVCVSSSQVLRTTSGWFKRCGRSTVCVEHFILERVPRKLPQNHTKVHKPQRNSHAFLTVFNRTVWSRTESNGLNGLISSRALHEYPCCLWWRCSWPLVFDGAEVRSSEHFVFMVPCLK